MTVTSLLLSIIYGWDFALATMFGAFLIMSLSYYINQRMHEKYKKTKKEHFASIAVFIEDIFNKIQTVKALALEQRVLSIFTKLQRDNNKKIRLLKVNLSIG